MARARNWDILSESQRKRYIGHGRKLGLSESDVRAYYESGGNLSAYRGQGRAKRAQVSEREWRELLRLAKIAELDKNPTGTPSGEILASLRDKGFSVEWIREQLIRQRQVRDDFRSPGMRRLRKQNPKSSAGYNPGRDRYQNRVQHADIEIYFYH